MLIKVTQHVENLLCVDGPVRFICPYDLYHQVTENTSMASGIDPQECHLLMHMQ